MCPIQSTIRESSGPRPRPNERALAQLWQNAHALAAGLYTQDGRRLRVVYPGRASGVAGPDFRDSVISTETGELVTGDVELHVSAPDWYGHRHHVDPNYNGVVLHVVLFPKGARTTRQQSKTHVPVASLSPHADEVVAANGPPTLLRFRGQGALGEFLDRAGDERFLAKSVGFTLQLKAEDPEEALYRALMEGLGYSANRRPFSELARAVPMDRLAELRSEPLATRLLAIRAMLFRAAGLLHLVGPEDEAERLRAALPRYARGKIDAGLWRVSGARPANHPLQRLEGAAIVLDRHLASGLARGLEEVARRGAGHNLVAALTARPFVGSGRAREIAVNVALPFLHSWAGVRRDKELASRSLELYRGFPKLPDNEITREMKRLLSPDIQAISIGSARRHQGLIHLYKTMAGRLRAVGAGRTGR